MSDRVPTQEQFDGLLAWLDQDRERAAMKYENIRRSLIRIFVWRGNGDPEALADETIDRVTQKVQEMKSSYVGDPALYFYGVAKRVALEELKRERRALQVTSFAAHDDSSDELNHFYEALHKCMGALSKDDRKLILEYYAHTKVEKVDHRKDMAKKLNLSQATLRKRVQRIREHLRRCIEEYMQ